MGEAKSKWWWWYSEEKGKKFEGKERAREVVEQESGREGSEDVGEVEGARIDGRGGEGASQSSSLDELPDLWCLLCEGSMSSTRRGVGPLLRMSPT